MVITTSLGRSFSKTSCFFDPGEPEKIHLGEVSRLGNDSSKTCSLNCFDLLVLREADLDNFTFPFWGGEDITGIVTEV